MNKILPDETQIATDLYSHIKLLLPKYQTSKSNVDVYKINHDTMLVIAYAPLEFKDKYRAEYHTEHHDFHFPIQGPTVYMSGGEFPVKPDKFHDYTHSFNPDNDTGFIGEMGDIEKLSYNKGMRIMREFKLEPGKDYLHFPPFFLHSSGSYVKNDNKKQEKLLRAVIKVRDGATKLIAPDQIEKLKSELLLTK